MIEPLNRLVVALSELPKTDAGLPLSVLLPICGGELTRPLLGLRAAYLADADRVKRELDAINGKMGAYRLAAALNTDGMAATHSRFLEAYHVAVNGGKDPSIRNAIVAESAQFSRDLVGNRIRARRADNVLLLEHLWLAAQDVKYRREVLPSLARYFSDDIVDLALNRYV